MCRLRSGSVSLDRDRRVGFKAQEFRPFFAFAGRPLAYPLSKV